MNKGYLLLIIAVVFFSSCHNKELLDPPYGDRSVIVVSDRDYASFVLASFSEAEVYIHVVMYSMKYYPDDSTNGVSQLLNELIYANERGVDVRVLLERSEYNSSLNEQNESTRFYLESNGIDVQFDSPTITTHGKLVIIDNREAFVGSANWSKSAIEKNNEVNVKINEEGIVEELESYFQNLWYQGTEVRRGTRDEGREMKGEAVKRTENR